MIGAGRYKYSGVDMSRELQWRIYYPFNSIDVKRTHSSLRDL